MKRSYVLRFPSSTEIHNQQIMVSYLDGGVDVNLRVGDDAGHYPLAVAAGVLNLEACTKLLKAGARADCWKKGSGTPMAYAVRALTAVEERVRRIHYARLLKLCALLMEYGADPYADDPYSALDLAAALGYREVVELLTGHGGRHSPEKRCFYSYTADGELVVGPDADINQAMDYAHRYKNEGVMVRLLMMGAKESCFREDGLTPFQAFVAQGFDKVAAYYVKVRGEDLAQRTESGKTLLQIAKNMSTKTLLRALKARLAAQEAVAPVSLGVEEIRVVHKGLVDQRRFEVFAI